MMKLADKENRRKLGVPLTLSLKVTGLGAATSARHRRRESHQRRRWLPRQQPPPRH